MFEGMGVGQLIGIVSPLVALQVALAAFCVAKILRRGTANLNKALWIAIVVLVNFLGPLAFLLFGKRKDA